MSKHTKAEPMICDDCFHNTVCRLDGNEMLEWCSARVPSADVVEVVRCKDCKHWNKCRFLGSDEIEEGLCRSFSDWGTPIRYDNDFCSYGERKESKVKKCFSISKELAEKLLEDKKRIETDD